MPRDNVHSNTQGDSTGQNGLEADGTLRFLKQLNLPVNRANYLALHYADPKITPDKDLGAGTRNGATAIRASPEL